MAQAPSKPPDRNGFKVAIICAMPLEAEMVELVFDKYWKDDGKRYGKAPGDLNAYTTGMIGNHNVVLTCPSSMDIKNAAVAPAYLRTSFQGIDIVFIVGVCGVVPIHLSTMVEIVLGDCIISTSIVQYDLGKLYPNGFVRKTTTEDSFSRASIEVRSLTSMLMTRRNRRLLTERLIYHLSILKELESDILYSGAKRDRLFEVSYNHQHRKRNEDCNLCILGGTTCLRDCDSIGCANEHTIQRQRFKLENDDDIPPQIHFGRFGSSNTLMKSGTDRDNIARNAELIAFEMESLGVWNSFPTVSTYYRSVGPCSRSFMLIAKISGYNSLTRIIDRD